VAEVTIADFIARCRSVRVDRGQGGPKPYKPLMLLAVLVLVDKGELTTPRVFLDGGLKSVYQQLLARLFPGRFPRADARYPFRHLANDGVWRLVPAAGLEAELAAQLGVGARAREVLRAVACSELDVDLFEALAADRGARLEVMRAICRAWSEVLPPETFETVGATPLDVSVAEVRAAAPRDRDAEISERALEEHLQTRWRDTPFGALGIELASLARHGIAGRQALTPVSAIDLLGHEAAADRWWVFELKKGRPSDAVVGQVSRYMGWIGRHVARTPEACVGAIIAREVDLKLEYAVRSNARLSLWRFDAALALERVA